MSKVVDFYRKKWCAVETWVMDIASLPQIINSNTHPVGKMMQKSNWVYIVGWKFDFSGETKNHSQAFPTIFFGGGWNHPSPCFCPFVWDLKGCMKRETCATIRGRVKDLPFGPKWGAVWFHSNLRFYNFMGFEKLTCLTEKPLEICNWYVSTNELIWSISHLSTGFYIRMRQALSQDSCVQKHIRFWSGFSMWPLNMFHVFRRWGLLHSHTGCAHRVIPPFARRFKRVLGRVSFFCDKIT